jgi:hypothetical protein
MLKRKDDIFCKQKCRGVQRTGGFNPKVPEWAVTSL